MHIKITQENFDKINKALEVLPDQFGGGQMYNPHTRQHCLLGWVLRRLGMDPENYCTNFQDVAELLNMGDGKLNEDRSFQAACKLDGFIYRCYSPEQLKQEFLSWLEVVKQEEPEEVPMNS